ATREAATQAHVADDASVTPGYLHVYHVLTSPFDSERLSAITRSRTYHRLAETILERAKVDSTISIPQETKEWWERTSLMGQHRPTGEPKVAPLPPPALPPKSRRFPVWMVLMLIFWIGRAVMMVGESSTETTRPTPQQMQYFQTSESAPTPASSSDSGALRLGSSADRSLMSRIALCDQDTRNAIMTQLTISKYNDLSVQANPQNDPMIASLLKRCEGSKYFDADGYLRRMPPPERERFSPDFAKSH
ncbi:MAG TPA: hypothetical protein VFS24_16305, partial [Steroidobacteraceae bacterium]|nr:hypothetical protein [Steroidobacteraceae bacterium]